MSKNIFITGVDTDIGKTFVSLGLCLSLKSKGYKVGYFKPFQSGAYEKENELIAPDLNELKKYDKDIETKYSYLFKGEVSPHLASLITNIEVDIEKVKQDLKEFSDRFDYTIVEGAGGLYCPAVKNNLFSDIIKKLDTEIIIVTTPALGRLNHTLMTIECAKLNNIKIKGLIINKVPKNPTLSEENFTKELKLFSDIKILGEIPNTADLSKDSITELFKDIEI